MNIKVTAFTVSEKSINIHLLIQIQYCGPINHNILHPVISSMISLSEPSIEAGFSIKTTFGEPLGVPVIKPTHKS